MAGPSLFNGESKTELVSYEGPGSGRTPFPYVAGSQATYRVDETYTASNPLAAGIQGTFLPDKSYDLTIRCVGERTLEDGKKYLCMRGAGGGLFSEGYYRVEENDIVSYGTRHMRNVSGPVKEGWIEPEKGSRRTVQFTYDGPVARKEDMLSSFMRLRVAQVTALLAVAFLMTFVIAFRQNAETFRDDVKQMVLASSEQDRQRAGAVFLSMVMNRMVLVLLLAGFLGSAFAAIILFH